MSYSLLFTTQAVLGITMVSFWRTYRIKSLLHPGMFFCGLWLFATTSCLVLSLFPETGSVVDEEMIDELNSFVLFTGLFFLVVKNWGKETILRNESVWHLENYAGVFKIISVAVLILGIVNFFIRGAGFNILEARLAMVEQSSALFYGEQDQSFLLTLVGGAVSFNAILCVMAGFELGRDSWKIHKIFLFLPLLAGFLGSLSVGGRMEAYRVITYYFLGYAIAGTSLKEKVHIKRLLLAGLLFFCIFSLFSFWIYRQRSMGRPEDSSWNRYAVLAPAVSIIDYFGSTYVGYQYRRNDFVTPEPDYGRKSFAGILFASVPFSALFLGRDASIGHLLELEQYTQKEMFLELTARNAPFYSSISPMYMLLYDDFGYFGTLAVCFLLVVLTHYIYLCWFRSPHRLLLSIYFLLVSFCFWSNSFFDPFTTSAMWKVLLTAIIGLEIARICLRRDPGTLPSKEPGQSLAGGGNDG